MSTEHNPHWWCDRPARPAHHRHFHLNRAFLLACQFLLQFSLRQLQSKSTDSGSSILSNWRRFRRYSLPFASTPSLRVAALHLHTAGVHLWSPGTFMRIGSPSASSRGRLAERFYQCSCFTLVAPSAVAFSSEVFRGDRSVPVTESRVLHLLPIKRCDGLVPKPLLGVFLQSRSVRYSD